MKNVTNTQYRKPTKADSEYSIADSCRDIPFKCLRCDALLAFVDRETRSEIRIKYKDLYVFIQDPKQFSILCRSCGHMGTITEQKEE